MKNHLMPTFKKIKKILPYLLILLFSILIEHRVIAQEPSKDTIVHIAHDLKFKPFKPEATGFKPLLFYSHDDKFHVGVSYTYINKKNTLPYNYKQYADVKYSISQAAFSSTYKGTFIETFPKWNTNLYANYDQVRWQNFYGLGNNTLLKIPGVAYNKKYNRMSSQTVNASAGAEHIFNLYHKISFAPFFQSVKIKAETDSQHYIYKSIYPVEPLVYKNSNFGGVGFNYVFQKINDSILPTKGIAWLTSLAYTANFTNSARSFGRFLTELNFYQPITDKLGITLKAGASTLSGTPEFYQYNYIGGTQTLRGYQRERFYGNTSFYNQNELRWITNVHTKKYYGKFGFLALYDIGRVWLKNENSNTLHNGVGGGIILSAMHKFAASIVYAVSPEDYNFHIRLIRPL